MGYKDDVARMLTDAHQHTEARENVAMCRAFQELYADNLNGMSKQEIDTSWEAFKSDARADKGLKLMQYLAKYPLKDVGVHVQQVEDRRKFEERQAGLMGQ